MAAAPTVAVLRTGDGGRGERGMTRPTATGKVALELLRFAPRGRSGVPWPRVSRSTRWRWDLVAETCKDHTMRINHQVVVFDAAA
jgi:hypothetical protein